MNIEYFPAKNIYSNLYICPACKHTWTDESDQVHDQDCPECKAEYVCIYESVKIDTDFYSIA